MFKVHSVDGGRNPAIEYLPAGAITPKLGLALVQSSGNLALATGANKPTYICMTEGASALTAGTVIPVIRVLPDMIFETTNQASFSSMNRGSKVTLHTDGAQVTATTTNGVAEVVDFDDVAASGTGGRVLVRFP